MYRGLVSTQTITYHSNMVASNTPKAILTISLAKYLKGEDVSEVIATDWAKAPATVASSFNNQGFNLDPTDVPTTLGALSRVLRENKWDGIIVGWCSRGNKDFTELFESVIATCIDMGIKPNPETKLMFCNGPDDLVGATLRSFPVE